MKKLLNNKGFSMVEILAVVVILGVVSTIGIVTVSRLVDSSRIHYYETQEDQLVLAAQSYANDNKNILPKTVGEMRTITLKELRENNYIKEEIVDQNKNKCYEEAHKEKDKNNHDVTLEGSRVEIYKSTKTDYIYTGYLECDACEKLQDKGDGNIAPTSCYTSKTKKEPSININIPKLNSNSNTILDKSHKITITIKGHASDTNIKVASYSYKIYQDNVVKFTSGLKINNKQPSVTITDELYKYVPGKVKVVVSTTNSDGISKSASSTVDLKDFKSPKCGRVSYDPNNQMTSYNSGTSIACGQSGYSWIGLNNATGSRQAWIICNDEFGQGCAQHEYSVNMTKEGENELVYLSDKTGNKQSELDKCTVKKCIDKTTPKIVVKVYKANASNGKSGSAVYTYDKPVSTTTGNYTIPQEKNNTWLNKNNFPNGVYVEVTVSDPLSKLKKYTWYQNEKNKKENATLTPNQKVEEKTWTYNQSGNNSYTKGINIKDDGVRIEKIQVWDQAGNSSIYNLILKIDRTAPPLPTVTMYLENNTSATSTTETYPNDKWKNKYVWINTSHPKDNPDVSGWKTNVYTSTGAHGAQTDKAANDVHINNEGTSTIKFRACDNAGNCTANYTSTKTIKLDRSNPKCTVKNTGGTSGTNGWYVGGTVTATGHCTDQTNLSKCKAETTQVQKVSSNSPNSGGTKKSITIYDNAGNSTTCSSTIKYDKSKPECSITKTNLNTTSGVTLTTTCSDNGPSGISQCESKHTGIKSSKTYTVKDNAGNTNKCSVTVSSKLQESHRSRTWNTCLTTTNTCKYGCDTCGGEAYQCCKAWGPSGYIGKENAACKSWGTCHKRTYSCNCSNCHTGSITCNGGWNPWGSWSGWTDKSGCSAGLYNGSKSERKCRTVYY